MSNITVVTTLTNCILGMIVDIVKSPVDLVAQFWITTADLHAEECVRCDESLTTGEALEPSMARKVGER